MVYFSIIMVVYFSIIIYTYGKYSNAKNSENAANQRITKNHLLDPMENFGHRHGKRAKKRLLLKKKSALIFFSQGGRLWPRMLQRVCLSGIAR